MYILYIYLFFYSLDFLRLGYFSILQSAPFVLSVPWCSSGVVLVSRMLGLGHLQKRRLPSTSRYAARGNGLFDQFWSSLVFVPSKRCLKVPSVTMLGVKLVSRHTQANSEAHRLCFGPDTWHHSCSRLHKPIAAIPTSFYESVPL